MLFPKLQDKENTSSLNQQAPVKKGPKVNGVRRALVPQAGAKQKVGAVDDDRQTRIPAQGLDNNALIKLISNGNKSLGTPPNKQMGQVHQGGGQEGTKENGQPPKNGATFVLDPSKFNIP